MLSSLVVLLTSGLLLVGANVPHQLLEPALRLQDQLSCRVTSFGGRSSGGDTENWRQNFYNGSRQHNETHGGRKTSPSSDKGVERGHRDPTAWRWRYLDEMLPPKYEIVVKDQSIDERLANVIYTVGTDRVLNGDAFKFNSGNRQQDEENARLVAGPNVDDELCGKHLRQLLGAIDELSAVLNYERANNANKFQLEERHIRLARLLDSYGHYESGYMSGRIYSMGAYPQCVKTKLSLDPNRPKELTGSRFCWARLSLEKHLNPTLKSRKKSEFDVQSHVLSTGICIPDSCHTGSFVKHKHLFKQLVDGQFKLPKSVYLSESLELESIFCTADANSQLAIPFNGKLLLGLIASWIALTLFVTFNRDRIESIKNKTIRLSLECLDLRASWNWFVGATEGSKNDRIDLDATNPIKWFGCTFVVFGHSILTRSAVSIDYLEGMQLADNTTFALVLLGTNIVDTFFGISGTLMSYIIMKKSRQQREKKTTNPPQDVDTQLQGEQPRGQSPTRMWVNAVGSFSALVLKTISKIILSRYLRLIPLFVLAFWFKKSVFMYLGGGPFWDHGFNRETSHGACVAESWWTPFTYVSALKPLTKQCLLQSWSVSSDIYFTIVFAPILVMMTRLPKLAATLTTIMCVTSTWAMATAVLRIDQHEGAPVKDLRVFGMSMLVNKFSYLYTTPYLRLSSFAIGMLSGYALYHYETSERLKDGWPNWFKKFATQTAAIYLCLVLYLHSVLGLAMRDYFYPHHQHLFLFFMTGGKLLWCTAQAIIFLRMMTDWKDTPIVKVFANKFWSSMAKTSYVVLMLHYDLLTLQASEKQTYMTNTWTLFSSFSSVYMICLPLAILVAIFFEYPKDRLVKTHLAS